MATRTKHIKARQPGPMRLGATVAAAACLVLSCCCAILHASPAVASPDVAVASCHADAGRHAPSQRPTSHCPPGSQDEPGSHDDGCDCPTLPLLAATPATDLGSQLTAGDDLLPLTGILALAVDMPDATPPGRASAHPPDPLLSGRRTLRALQVLLTV